MTGPKIANLQALRGLAVLLVLLRHVSVMEGKYGHHESLLPDFYNAGTGGVDLFFVISGFIMVTICRGRHRQPGAFRDFLYRRATRIYPLYWVFSLVILGIWLVQPGWVNSSSGSQVNVLTSFLLLPQSIPPLLGQGWTLIHEVYFYFVFAFALLLPERRLPAFLGGWAIALVLGWVFVLPSLPEMGAAAIRMVFHPLTAEFLFGAASALCVHRTGPRAGAFCFFGGCVALAFMLGGPSSDIPSIGHILMRSLPLLAMVHGAVAMERTGILLPRALREVGEVAYSIYLSHILVISAIGRAWSSVGPPGLWDNLVVSVLMIAASIGFGFGCHHFLEAPLLRLTHRWRPWNQSHTEPARALGGKELES